MDMSCMYKLIWNKCIISATGEPPLCLSVSVLFALKNAIDSARKDAGNTDWYQISKYILYSYLFDDKT
jgi:hypothetical protein